MAPRRTLVQHLEAFAARTSRGNSKDAVEKLYADLVNRFPTSSTAEAYRWKCCLRIALNDYLGVSEQDQRDIAWADAQEAAERLSWALKKSAGVES